MAAMRVLALTPSEDLSAESDHGRADPVDVE
jgi:hypothetical protein